MKRLYLYITNFSKELTQKILEMDAPLKAPTKHKVLFYFGLFVLVTGAVMVGNTLTNYLGSVKVAPPAPAPATSQTATT